MDSDVAYFDRLIKKEIKKKETPPGLRSEAAHLCIYILI